MTKQNKERAKAALIAVRAFAATPWGEPIINREVLEQNIADLLANLGHLCDREGFSFPVIYERAAGHYLAETRNVGAQFESLPLNEG